MFRRRALARNATTPPKPAPIAKRSIVRTSLFGSRVNPLDENAPACSRVTAACAARTTRSTRTREAQVDLRRGRIRPARGHDLAARVEVDPLRPVDVRVAEERVLPAAE